MTEIELLTNINFHLETIEFILTTFLIIKVFKGLVKFISSFF